MSKKRKLMKRLLSKPTDFTMEELETLLRYFGLEKSTKGRTSGSRVEFTRDGKKGISLHQPHPNNTLKPYQMKQVTEFLKKERLL